MRIQNRRRPPPDITGTQFQLLRRPNLRRHRHGAGGILVLALAGEGGAYAGAGGVFGAFDEEGGDAFAEAVGEPDNLGFFEAGGGGGLEEEGGDGVSHF